MTTNIHAYACSASALRFVRADFFQHAISRGMAFDGWKSRLWEKIEEDERVDRRLSLEAGLGPNYLSQLRKSGNSPTIDSALKLCETLNISFLWVLTGLDIDADGQELLEIASRLHPRRRRSLIDALRPEQASSDPS